MYQARNPQTLTTRVGRMCSLCAGGKFDATEGWGAALAPRAGRPVSPVPGSKHNVVGSRDLGLANLGLAPQAIRWRRSAAGKSTSAADEAPRSGASPDPQTQALKNRMVTCTHRAPP